MNNNCPPLLEQALNSWRHWTPAPDEKPRLLSRITGGETNLSFLVIYGRRGKDCRAVVRINAVDARTLGIDRQREARVLAVAARAGLAPAVLHLDPEYRFMVSDYIDGRIWLANDFGDPVNRRRLETLIQRVQSLQLDLPRFDYLIHIDQYWQKAREINPGKTAMLEPEYRVFVQFLADFQHQNWQPVICHHDLIPGNLIENNDQLYLLDWEYAAAGHPAIDRIRVGLPIASSPQPVYSLVYWLDHLWHLAQP